MTIDSLNLMLAEIIVFLALAALLGLVIGWLIRGSLAKRKLATAQQEFATRLRTLEESSQQDAKNLEDQIQSLGDELKGLKSNNQNLNESLKETESSIHQARSDSIELNQAQLETNEKLQNIIKDKDKEIQRLMSTPPSKNANLEAAAAALGASKNIIGGVLPSSDEDIDGSETLDATTVLSGPLHQNLAPESETASSEKTVAALEASAHQLRSERQALLDALTDGEETIAIDHRDLPLELQNSALNADIDATIALDNIDDLDATVNLNSGDDTDLDDTQKTT